MGESHWELALPLACTEYATILHLNSLNFQTIRLPMMPFEHYLGCKSYSTLILNNTKRKVALRKLLSHAGFDFNILLVWLGPRSETWVKRQGHRLGNTALDSILKLVLFTYSGSTSGAAFSSMLSPPNLPNFCFQANTDLSHNYNFFWEYIFWKKLALSGHFSRTLLIQK